MRLKLLSWNIWINGHFDGIKAYLEEADADIIALQEVKDTDPAFDVIGYLHARGYQHVFMPVRKRWGENVFSDGPALFSRLPILEMSTHLLSSENPRGAVATRIQAGEAILNVFSTHTLHTHQGVSAVQSEQIETLIRLLPSERVIVMGDFNATPESPIMERMREVLEDADPHARPTWSVYPEGCQTCNPQELDTKLDYIFTSKDIKVRSFKVGNSKGSDHLPISAVIEI